MTATKTVIARNWIFVTNNPIENDYNQLDGLECKGLVWQEERGDSGTLHIQGYVELHKPTTRASIVRRLGGRASVLVRSGSRFQAWDYTQKETFEGARKFDNLHVSQGERTDIETIREKIKSGQGMLSIAEEHFGSFIRYNRGFYLYKALLSKPRTELSQIEIYWGASGAGKSHTVLREYPEAYWVPKCNSGCVWFTGYEGHDTIVFDNYYGWCPYDLLLRICDKYPLQVPIHGGMVNFTARKIVFTSVKPWTEWYDWLKCDQTELARRVKLGKVYKVVRALQQA